MPPERIVLNDWLLTPERIAVHLPTETGVVGDLHLGYEEARIGSGDAVPVRSLAEQLTPLRQCARRCGFRRLVIAGDLFEKRAESVLLQKFGDFLKDCRVEWAGWVPGNHDRGWELFQEEYPLKPEGVLLDDWMILHGDQETMEGKIVMGHWHPRLSFRRRSCPCFLAHPARIVLPAFSMNAAGVSVRARPWRGYQAFPIVGNEVEAGVTL